ncbi:MAG TPA: SDR family oxidoreductase [Thermomicrobiaceae bacterium]|nr:SDR family oxidoreductase [Thermomicrobiaceae bacterium]
MILVVGATGQLGGEIAQRLLQRGDAVRMLVRPGSNYQPLAALGAEPVFGDLKDSASLGPALDGVDTVVTTANSAQRLPPDTIEAVDLHGNASLVDAARAAGVGQFVFISALGADPISPSPFLQAKARTEERLRAGGMPYTILEPTIYMEVWAPMIVGQAVAQQRPVILVAGGQRHHSWVSRSDVAALTLATIGNPRALDQTILVGGPEPLSWRDIIATYERVLGRTIPVESVTLGEPVPGLPRPIVELLSALETFDAPLDMRETQAAYDLPLTSLESVVRRMANAPEVDATPGRG